MRIAIGQLSQESNTFNPLPTTMADFDAFGIYAGEELLLRMAETNEPGGFIQELRQWPEKPEIVPLIRLMAWPSGPATKDTFAELMRLMLEAPAPRDYVIGSGALHTVQDFAERAFGRAGRDWRAHVKVDPSAHKAVARATYHGDITAISRDLGWRPTTTFDTLVARMVDVHRRA